MANEINKYDSKERVAFELFQKLIELPPADQQRCLDTFYLCIKAVNGDQVDISKSLPQR